MSTATKTRVSKEQKAKNSIEQNKRVRQPGLDLIRCLAFLLVVMFHSFLQIGHSYVPQEGVYVWAADTFRFLSISCIGLYLMLSGYLKCNNTSIKSCYRSIPPLLVSYFLACAICIPVRHFLLDDVKTFAQWIKKVFDFTAVSYGWYVEMFLGLSLLIPFINMALSYLGNNKKGLYVMAAVLLFLTAVPGATAENIAPDYWRITYPVTYYVLGAVVRKLQPKLNAFLGLFLALLSAGLLGLYTILNFDGAYKDFRPQREFQDIWIAIIVVLLFVALYNVKIPAMIGKVLAFMASGCYCGYMLSSLFDAYFYKLVPQWKTPEKYILIFVCVTIPIYIASMFSGVALQKITDLLLLPMNKQKKLNK